MIYLQKHFEEYVPFGEIIDHDLARWLGYFSGYPGDEMVHSDVFTLSSATYSALKLAIDQPGEALNALCT